MRLIGIDHGGRRTGIAIGELQPRGVRMALPFEMFEGLPDAQLAAAVVQLVKREGVDAVVIGLPLNADNTPSQQSRIVERFIVTLQQQLDPRVKIHRYSEYLSTHDSESKLAGHFTRQQKRQRVDALAAARILQDFMDQQGEK